MVRVALRGVKYVLGGIGRIFGFLTHLEGISAFDRSPPRLFLMKSCFLVLMECNDLKYALVESTLITLL